MNFSWPDILFGRHVAVVASGWRTPVLPAPLSEDRAAAFHEDESAALVGDRRSGSTATQSAVDANDH